MKLFPSFGGGREDKGSPLGDVEYKDAATARASAGRGYPYVGQPYVPPGDNIDRLVRDGYEKVIWAFRAIDAIANKMSDWPIVCIEGTGDSAKQVEDPVLPLLNAYSNEIERSAKWFRYRLVSQLLLSKRGVFVEVIPNRVGRIKALNLLPPGLTAPIPDANTFIAGFRVETPGMPKPHVDLRAYDPDKPDRGGVIWIRKPHPTDPYSGVTPLEAAGISLDLDFYARLYNRNFLLNDGRAGQLVAVKGGLSPEDAAELKARFSPGMGGAGRTTVIEAEAISVQDTAISPRDAQYAELRNITRDDLLIALGTPESVLGNASGRTFDNADAEKENWLDVTVLPLSGVVNAGFDVLTKGGWGDDRRIAHDVSNEPVLRRAQERKIEKARTDFAAGLITVDEFREVAERDPIGRPGTKVLWLPGGKVAVGADADEKAAGALKPVGSPNTDPVDGGGLDAQFAAAFGQPQDDTTALTEAGLGDLELKELGMETGGLDLEEKAYNPKQPRYPMNHPDGGKFMDVGDVALWLAGKPFKDGTPSDQTVDPNPGSTDSPATTQGGAGGAARFLTHSDPAVRAAAAMLSYPPGYQYARVLGAPAASIAPRGNGATKLVSLRKGDVVSYSKVAGGPWTVAGMRKVRGTQDVELELVGPDGDVTTLRAGGQQTIKAEARTPHPTAVAAAKRTIIAAANAAPAAPAPAPAAARAATPVPPPPRMTQAPASALKVPSVGADGPFSPASGVFANNGAWLIVRGDLTAAFVPAGGGSPVQLGTHQTARLLARDTPGDVFRMTGDASTVDVALRRAGLPTAGNTTPAPASAPTSAASSGPSASAGAGTTPGTPPPAGGWVAAGEVRPGAVFQHPNGATMTITATGAATAVARPGAPSTPMGRATARTALSAGTGYHLVTPGSGTAAGAAKKAAASRPAAAPAPASAPASYTVTPTSGLNLKVGDQYFDAQTGNGPFRITAIRPDASNQHRQLDLVDSSGQVGGARIHVADLFDVIDTTPAPAPAAAAPSAPAPSTGQQFNLPTPPPGAVIYAHPAGKHIYVLPDGTVQVWKPNGARATTSATAAKLAAGHGQWKRVPAPATGPIPSRARAAGAPTAPPPAAAPTPTATAATVPPVAPVPPTPAPAAPTNGGRAAAVLAAGVPSIGVGPGWTDNGSQSGSNPAAFMTDPAGVRHYVKSQPAKVADNEVTAALFYAAAGVEVPTVRRATIGNGSFRGQTGTAGIASEVVQASNTLDSKMASDPAFRDAVHEDFAVHAWLGNWDAIENGNTQVSATGKPVTIDVGGSIAFRARGGARVLDDKVLELQTMRNSSAGGAARAAFRGVTPDSTDARFVRGVERIAEISPAQIRSLVDAGMPSFSVSERTLIADKLIKRRAHLAQEAGVTLPENRTGGAPAAPAPAPAAVPTPQRAQTVSPGGTVNPTPASFGPGVTMLPSPQPGFDPRQLGRGDIVEWQGKTYEVTSVARSGNFDLADPSGASAPFTVTVAQVLAAAPQGVTLLGRAAGSSSATPAPQPAAAAPSSPGTVSVGAGGVASSYAHLQYAVPATMPAPPITADEARTLAGAAGAPVTLNTFALGRVYVTPLGAQLVVAQDGTAMFYPSANPALRQYMDRAAVTSYVVGGARLYDLGTPVDARTAAANVNVSTPAAPSAPSAAAPSAKVQAALAKLGNLTPDDVLDPPSGYPYPILAGAPVATTLKAPKPIKAASLRAGDVISYTGLGVTVQSVDRSSGTVTALHPNGSTIQVPAPSGTHLAIARTPHPTVTAAARTVRAAGAGQGSQAPAAPAPRLPAGAAPPAPAPGAIPAGSATVGANGPWPTPPTGTYERTMTSGALSGHTLRLTVDPSGAGVLVNVTNGSSQTISPAQVATRLTGTVGAKWTLTQLGAPAPAAPAAGTPLPMPFGGWHAGNIPPGSQPPPGVYPLGSTPASGTMTVAPDGSGVTNNGTHFGNPAFVAAMVANGGAWSPTASGAGVVNTQAAAPAAPAPVQLLPSPILDFPGDQLVAGDQIEYQGRVYDVTGINASGDITLDHTASGTPSRIPATLVQYGGITLLGRPQGTPLPAGITPPAPAAPAAPTLTPTPRGGWGPAGQVVPGAVFRHIGTGEKIVIGPRGGAKRIDLQGVSSNMGNKAVVSLLSGRQSRSWHLETPGPSAPPLTGGGTPAPAPAPARPSSAPDLPPPGTPIAGTPPTGAVYPPAATGTSYQVAASTVQRGATVRVGSDDYVITGTELDANGDVQLWGYRPGVDDPNTVTQDPHSLQWMQGVKLPTTAASVTLVGPVPTQQTGLPTVANAKPRDYDPSRGQVDSTRIGSRYGAATTAQTQIVDADTLAPGDLFLLNGREDEGWFVVTSIEKDHKGRDAVHGYSATAAEAGQPVTPGHLFLPNPGSGARQSRVAVTNMVPPLPDVPRARPPRGASGVIVRNNISDAQSQAEVARIMNRRTTLGKAPNGQASGDRQMSWLLELRGYNGLPDVVSEAEMDAYVEDGEIELWRNITNTSKTADGGELTRSGDNFPGGGGGVMFGLGHYTSYGRDAIRFAQGWGYQDSTIIRMTLKKDARVAEYDQLWDEMAASTDPIVKAMHARNRSRGGNSPGVGLYAAYMGYDAIRKSNGYGSTTKNPDDWEDGFLIIVNRTAVRVSSKNYLHDNHNVGNNSPVGNDPPPLRFRDMKKLPTVNHSRQKHDGTVDTRSLTREP